MSHANLSQNGERRTEPLSSKRMRAGIGASQAPQLRRTDRSENILLVYDAECPVCDLYCRSVDVRPAAGELTLVDARHSTSVMDEITDAGLDIDQGMVLKVGDSLYYGSDAIHALALLSPRADTFNRLNHWIFRSRSVSRAVYPVLRTFRNLLLKVMGKSKINNLKLENNDSF